LSGSYPNPVIAPGAVTDAKVAAANKDGAANVPSLRTLGGGALQAMPGNAQPGGPPTGAAAGALSGSYPNPTLSVSGGDSGPTACKNGEALSALSTGAALTCSPGVYSDTNSNVAAGPSPFGALISGARENVALGPSMLSHDTGGYFNTASGSGALSANTMGDANTASGDAALQDNTTGNVNTANGEGALFSNTTGVENTASGVDALFSNTTGVENTASGVSALFSNTTGNSNTASGASALSSTTGNANTALGFDAGDSLTTGSDNIDIGEGQTGGPGESGTIRIGNGDQTKAFLGGVFGATVTSGATVLANSSGQLGTISSSRRFKTDIHPIGSALDRLMALRPVSFYYKARFAHGQRNPLQFGLIAEDVAKVFPNLVVDGPDGKPYTVAYQELPALLLAEIQRQQRQIDQLKAQNRRIDALQAEVDSLTRHRGRS
jgi:hypothetical protein